MTLIVVVAHEPNNMLVDSLKAIGTIYISFISALRLRRLWLILCAVVVILIFTSLEWFYPESNAFFYIRASANSNYDQSSENKNFIAIRANFLSILSRYSVNFDSKLRQDIKKCTIFEVQENGYLSQVKFRCPRSSKNSPSDFAESVREELSKYLPSNENLELFALTRNSFLGSFYNVCLFSSVLCILLLGSTFVFYILRYYFSDRLRFGRELVLLTHRPVHIAIGKLRKKRREVSILINGIDDNVESFNFLRVLLSLEHGNRMRMLIAVTSGLSGEGKSTIASNLAIAFAMSGKKTVLVDMDSQKKSISRIFPGKFGFYDFLDFSIDENQKNIESAEKYERAPTAFEKLEVIVAGISKSSSSITRLSERIKLGLKSLQCEEQVVILDCPPVLLRPETLLITKNSDVTIFISSIGKSSRTSIARASEMLNWTGCKKVYNVLNRVDGAEEEYYSAYHFYYGHGSAHESYVENIRSGNVTNKI